MLKEIFYKCHGPKNFKDLGGYDYWESIQIETLFIDENDEFEKPLIDIEDLGNKLLFIINTHQTEFFDSDENEDESTLHIIVDGYYAILNIVNAQICSTSNLDYEVDRFDIKKGAKFDEMNYKKALEMGLNIVTCGNCGEPMTHKCDVEIPELECKKCGCIGESSDFPDLYTI